MKFVQPIRDKDQINLLKKVLRDKSERDYLMFMIGINVGLRVSDILPLKVGDVRGTHIKVIEQKTKKVRRVAINNSLRKALNRYILDKKDSEVLLKSREGNNKPISRSMAYKILREAAEEVGISEVGTHTMRKTFGYHIYQRDKDVAALQKLFNHDKPTTTLLYIGVEQDHLDKVIMNSNL